MKLALIAALLLVPLSQAGSLTGVVVDATGAYIPHAFVELDSGAQKYQVQADDEGVYRFLELPAREYSLTFTMVGFKRFTLKSIAVLEREQKRIPDVPLDIGSCGSPSRDLALLPPRDSGRLSGRVLPAVAGVDVTLVCRTFTPCRSTKTDSNGHFSFDMISAGVYGLNFHREGFYPENATHYAYFVNTGWESVYSTVQLERCPNSSCDLKLRPERLQQCE